MPRDAYYTGMSRAPLAVPNATAAVVAALRRPSHCVPVGGVLLSMSNPHHRPLRELQFQRVRHVRCLMDRVVSVCWGEWDDGLGTCVRVYTYPPTRRTPRLPARSTCDSLVLIGHPVLLTR